MSASSEVSLVASLRLQLQAGFFASVDAGMDQMLRLGGKHDGGHHGGQCIEEKNFVHGKSL